MISAGIEAVLIKVAAMGMQACYIFPKKKMFLQAIFFYNTYITYNTNITYVTIIHYKY